MLPAGLLGDRYGRKKVLLFSMALFGIGASFVAFPIGPILGGWLLSNYWWSWVLLINVPTVLIGLAAAIALVPESRAAARDSTWPEWSPRRPGWSR